MVFNNLFTPKNKKTTAELFLAVEIHESMIKSAVWQVEDETPSIIALGSYELWDSEDSLINGVDASLSEAIRGLSSEPDRVIFGLPDSWLSENRVHPTKQKLIKRLISELTLKPIGMVTITEAIVSHLKVQEGVPPTAILLEIYPSKVIVSLVNLGEIQAQEEVGRSDDLARDVEEGLARFEAEKLPARFILTNGNDLENEEQQIIGYPWNEKLPFIHLPKVQVLPIDFSIRAIALSGGSEAAKSIGMPIATQVEESETEETKSDAAVESVTSNLTSVGFVLEGEEGPQPQSHDEQAAIEMPEPEEVAPVKPKTNFFSRLPRPTLPKFSLRSFSLPQVKLGRLALIVPVFLLVLGILGVVGFYFYFGKVAISLFLSPVRVNQTIDVAIGTGTKENFLSVIAAKKTLSAKVSGSTITTGEAVVGDKATGKVTIYNLSNQSVNLKEGAKITSANNLSFILDSAVTLASASSQFNENGPVFPSKEVNVTAGKLGAESNLDKLTSFSVENYPKSVLTARADANFAGGSSRTVKAVDKADQEKLQAELSEKIKSAIDEQLKKDDPDSRSLVVGALRYTTKTFDHAVGQEAGSLNLDLAADLDVLVYSYKEMVTQIEKKILGSQNAGLVIASDQTQVGLTDPTPIDANTFATKANVSAFLFPEIDEEKISNTVKGKQAIAIKNILQTLPGYQSALVYVSPNIPLLSRLLPLNPKHYSYSVSTK